jgi:hypothetical protein
LNLLKNSGVRMGRNYSIKVEVAVKDYNGCDWASGFIFTQEYLQVRDGVTGISRYLVFYWVMI